MVAVKEYEPISDLIDKLLQRKMHLGDRDFAKRWLRNVGYYRLSAYWYPYREFLSEDPPIRGDDFIPGTTFEDIAGLYEFDRKLRTLVHDGIERIEIGLRTQLNEYLGEVGGALAYQDPAHFRPRFKHTEWLEIANGRVERAQKDNTAIRHHHENYGGQIPMWVLSEVLDFSDVSKLYDGLFAMTQHQIAENLGIHIDLTQLRSNQRKKAKDNHPLARWFEHLTVIRNTAAHHSRLWNRSFTPVSTPALRTMDEFQTLPKSQSEQVYGALCVMNVLLRKLSPTTSWPVKVRALIEETFVELELRHPSEIGCPEGWQESPIWNG